MLRKSFTLVELLTVIAIIAILAAIAVPATIAVRKSAMRTEAANDIAAIKLAMESFMTKYNQSLPYRRNENGKVIVEGSSSGDNYYCQVAAPGVIAGEYTTFMQNMAGEATAYNPSKTVFLNPRNKQTDGHAEYVWLDPWDHPYVILFAPPGERGIKIDGQRLYGKVFVASFGDVENAGTVEDLPGSATAVRSWD